MSYISSRNYIQMFNKTLKKKVLKVQLTFRCANGLACPLSPYGFLSLSIFLTHIKTHTGYRTQRYMRHPFNLHTKNYGDWLELLAYQRYKKLWMGHDPPFLSLVSAVEGTETFLMKTSYIYTCTYTHSYIYIYIPLYFGVNLQLFMVFSHLFFIWFIIV